MADRSGNAAAAAETDGRCAGEPGSADGGCGGGAAGIVREPGEPVAVARGGAGAGVGDSDGAGGEPVAVGAAIAGGNRGTGVGGRWAGSGAFAMGVAAV